MTLVRGAALAAALCLSIWFSASPAWSEPSSEDKSAIRAAISNQIGAFGRDDGEAAYAIASDPIRAMFPSVEAFLDMVKKGYAPVYRPRSVVFGSIADGETGPVQEVFITDAQGVDWIAQYTLSRDAEGRWRIDGCRLQRNERSSA